MNSPVGKAATGVFFIHSAEHHMNSLTYFTLDRDVRQLRGADVQALAARISGGLVTAGDAGYEDARKVWNATVDRRPAAIAR